MSKVIGIDLGTTTNGDTHQLLPLELGERAVLQLGRV